MFKYMQAHVRRMVIVGVGVGAAREDGRTEAIVNHGRHIIIGASGVDAAWGEWCSSTGAWVALGHRTGCASRGTGQAVLAEMGTIRRESLRVLVHWLRGDSPPWRHEPSSTLASCKKFTARESVQPGVAATQSAGSVALGSKLSALEIMQPAKRHEPPWTLAIER